MADTFDFVMSIATRRRFAATFWRELAAARKENPDITRRAVFDRLEDAYEAAFGEELWTYDTFRHSKEFKEA